MSKRSNPYSTAEQANRRVRVKRLTRQRREREMQTLIKRTLNVENKYFTQTYNLTTYPTAGTFGASWTNSIGLLAAVNTIFAPIAGNDINQRIGRKCAVSKIKLRGVIHVPADVTIAQGIAPAMRILLVVMKQAKGQIPLPAELMETNGIYAFQSADHFGEFMVLKDIIIDLPSLATTSNTLGTFNTEGYEYPWKITHKFNKPLQVLFDRFTTGTSDDIQENNIFVCSMASNVTYAPRLGYSSRVDYTDV